MKSLLPTLLTHSLLVFALVACGGESSDDSSSNREGTNSDNPDLASLFQSTIPKEVVTLNELTAMLAEHDRDADGRVTRTECGNNEAFDAFNTDGDDVVTLSDGIAALTAILARFDTPLNRDRWSGMGGDVLAFPVLDRNRDGVLTTTDLSR